ncbi:MAG: Ig-like domain-containing protein, partial [Rhodocyclales bacterium]|nr:Ig-like domain-containing protein [Rhodocyclales bacterium]
MAVYTGTSANNNWTVPRNGGTDIYDGQGGTDKLMFDRLLRSRFTITQGTDGYIHVDSVAGASSTFRIKVVNLELLAFNYGRDVLNLTTYFDSTPPTVASFVPADEATNIAPGANIVITFSEAIARGTGTIALKNAAGTIVESFDAAASARLTISGTTLTIDPTADLLLGTGYTLELPAGSIKDVSGNSYAGTSTYNFTTITAAAANAAPTGGVTITGTATQGATLTAANTLADANGLGTIGYQWKANGIEIAGATASTIVLAEAQVGATITVTASYVDGIGNAEAMTSAATSAVANVNDAPTGAVTIAGTPTQGQTLTASNTLDDPDGRDIVNYQWQADGVNISGATADTLILAEAQVGKAIAVVASYTDGHGTLETVAGTATAAVANINDAPRGCIRVTGVPVAGETLSAQSTLTDADGLGTLSYHWQSSANGIDWADIAGATAATFAATGNLVGQQLRVVGNYVDGHGTQETANSMPAAILASLAGKTADVAVYAWKTHTVLGGVTLAQSTTTQTTAADGHASFSGVTGTSLALTADRPIPTSEASATASA